MPCKATITARGAPPSASQRRSGRRAPSRATIASLLTCGVTPPSRTGAKVGAQAQRNRKRKARPRRTSHLKTLRQGVLIAQHQHADHKDMVYLVRIHAEWQDGTLVI